jgi:uncharacterized protein (TIGR00255 family)
MKSLTGYGFADETDQNKIVRVEIKSLNSKYFECKVNLPKNLSVLEPKFIDYIKSKIKRGKVSCNIYYFNLNEDDKVILPDINTVKHIETAVNKISKIIDKDLDIQDFLIKYDALNIMYDTPDGEKIYKEIIPVLNKAMEKLLYMKEKEGKNLLNDLKDNLEKIKKSINNIEENADKVRGYYKSLFSQKVKQYLDSIDYDKERFEQEIFYYTQRADINEEIVRLWSHIEKIDSLLNADYPVGIKLDFILQEMNREINTIGSKTPILEITNQVITVKTYINKIREQARNIE